MDVHDDELRRSSAQIHLAVIGRPAPASDPSVQRQHGRPVALPRHRTDENETILGKKKGFTQVAVALLGRIYSEDILNRALSK